MVKASDLMKEIDGLRKAMEERGLTAEEKKDLLAIRRDLADLRKAVHDLPVVTADEARQIYQSEAEAEAPVCPSCGCPLEGNETDCPKCATPLEWPTG